MLGFFRGSGVLVGRDDDIEAQFQRLLAEQAEQDAAPGAGARPSRESMREVKREAKERAKAREQQEKAAAAYWAKESGRQQRGRAPVVVGVAAVLALGGGAGWWYTNRSASPAPVAASAARATPTATGKAKAAPKPTASTDPVDEVTAFVGTPASHWSDGAKGIVLPSAKQVGIFRSTQVAQAYRKTAAYLKTAMLDPSVVYRGKLAPVLDTIGASSQDFIRGRVQSGWKDKKSGDIASWTWIANRFRPGDWTAASNTIRVNGFMRARPGSRSALTVDFTYLAAYWLRPANGGAPRAVVVRRDGEMDYYGDGPGAVSDSYYGGSGVTTSASVCGARWPYPQYLEVWLNRDAAVVPTPSTEPLPPSNLLSEPTTKPPEHCYHDVSGF